MSKMMNALAVGILLGLLSLPGLLLAQDGTGIIGLLPPDFDDGNGVLTAARDRQSERAFGPAPLGLAHLSEVLWMAGGVNRPDSQMRTTPSAMNAREITVYAFLPDGAYRYNPLTHTLEIVLAGDHRAATGSQDFVPRAALNLVYVADFSRLSFSENKAVTAALDVGHNSQNVYLYCASAGLAVVTRSTFDGPALHELLKLGPDDHVVLTQSVGPRPE